jgi:hypothetical protein
VKTFVPIDQYLPLGDNAERYLYASKLNKNQLFGFIKLIEEINNNNFNQRLANLM